MSDAMDTVLAEEQLEMCVSDINEAFRMYNAGMLTGEQYCARLAYLQVEFKELDTYLKQ